MTNWMPFAPARPVARALVLALAATVAGVASWQGMGEAQSQEKKAPPAKGKAQPKKQEAPPPQQPAGEQPQLI